MSGPSRRSQVFISYSHKDRKVFDQLQTSLRPLIRDKKVELWDDTRIAPGRQWKQDIESAIASAKVAVLLVSPDFLASDFIAENELPPLIEAAEQEGLIILWVPVRPSLYTESVVKNYQAAISPDKPLSAQRSHERERSLVLICELIKNAVAGRPEAPAPSRPQTGTQQKGSPQTDPQQKDSPPAASSGCLVRSPAAAAVSDPAVVVEVVDASTVVVACGSPQDVEVGQKFLIFRPKKEARTEEIQGVGIDVEDVQPSAVLLAAAQVTRVEGGRAVLQAVDIESISHEGLGEGLKSAGFGAALGTLIAPGLGTVVGAALGSAVHFVMGWKNDKPSDADFSQVEVGDLATPAETVARGESRAPIIDTPPPG